jgi:hypothetical protein
VSGAFFIHNITGQEARKDGEVMEVKVYAWHTEVFPTDEEVKQLCRPGEGADTCVWLVMSPKGWECTDSNRPHALLDRWSEGKTSAKRDGCEEARKAVDKAIAEINA